MPRHLRFQGKPLLPLWLLTLFLASCQWVTPMHTQTPRSGLQTASGPGDFSLLSANTPQTGQMITLPSQVRKSPLQALEEPPKGKHFRLHLSTKASGQGKNTSIRMPEQGAFELVIQSGPQFKVLDANASDGQAVVQMPASNYQALLKLHGKHTRTQKRSLQLEDSLYYLSHELQRSTQGKGSFQILSQAKAKKLELKPLCSSDPEHYRLWRVHNPNSEELEYSWQVEGSQQSGTEVAPPGDSVLETEAENGVNKLLLDIDSKRQDSSINKGLYCDPEEAERSLWWQVGPRTLPVPSAWKSSDGDKYVLRLNNQGVTDLTFRWYKTPNQAVALPPGTAEIGAAGGTVELPGVAKLEIPAGALSQTEVVRIIEEKQAPSLLIRPPDDPEKPFMHAGRPYEYFTPFLRIEPFQLDLQKPATVEFLDLPVSRDFYSQVYRGSGGFRGKFAIFNAREFFSGSYASQEYTQYAQRVTKLIYIDDPVKINKFGYTSLLIEKGAKFDPNNLPRIQINQNFQIQNAGNSFSCSDYQANHHIAIVNDTYVFSDHFKVDFANGGLWAKTSAEDKCAFGAHLESTHHYLREQGLTYSPNYERITVKTNTQEQDPISGTTKAGQYRLACAEGTCEPTYEAFWCPQADLSTQPCQWNQQAVLGNVAHEIFHFFQAGFADANSFVVRPDLWFIEGSATWFAAHFVDKFHGSFAIPNYNPHFVGGEEVQSPNQVKAGHLKSSLSYPFLKEASHPLQPYYKASFFHVLDTILSSEKSINFGLNKDFQNKIAQQNIFRTLITTHEGIQSKDQEESLQKIYHTYAKKALIVQDTNQLDTNFDPVALEKPLGINGVITEQHTAENPLSISVTLDTMTSKYIHLVPLLLSGSQTVKFRFKQDNPVAPQKINEYDTLPYIGVSVAGVNNPQGEAAIIDANHIITRNLLGDFQSLPVPSSTAVQTEDPGIVLSDAQSAVLVVSNGQWVVQPENPVTVTIEAYIEGNRFRSIDPDLIKAQKTTQVLVQGTDLESLNQVIIQSTEHPYTVYTAPAAYNTDSHDLSVSIPGLTAGNYKIAGLLQSGAQCYIPSLQPPLDAPPPSGAPPSGSPPSGAPPSEPPTQDLCVLTNALSLAVSSSPPQSNLIQAQRFFLLTMNRLDNAALMIYKRGESKPFYIRYASGSVGNQAASTQTAFLSRFSNLLDNSPESEQIIQFDFTPYEPGNPGFNAKNSPFFDLSKIHGEIIVKTVNWSPPPSQGSGNAGFVVSSHAGAHITDSSGPNFIWLAYRHDGHSQGINESWEVGLLTNESKSFGFNLPEFFTNEGLSEVYFDLIEEHDIDPASVTG